MSATAGSVFDSCSFTHQFKLNFEETKNADIGKHVSSGDISAGGHLWRILCYPRIVLEKYNGEYSYLGVFLSLESETKYAKAIFEAFVMDGNGVPSSSRKHSLLESTDGSDVSFVVDGEEFPAHRAVLAARSPVFKAQLLGSMAEAKMSSISLQDIAPATLKAMLRFIYTDDLPIDEDGDEELPTEAFQDLLAAADRFALDRLKLICAKKLWDDVSTDTVGATLACAETYSCRELKMKCLDFFADEKNFKEAVLTDGFVQLVQTFPAILAELRVKVVGS
ncbi:hypothetical protein HU200_065802 [Digitaria exilis]|uniref:BTB domain-containing protein n=1 Tax=Digitaria exilis TaxID=1010633 RepID=A0A834ZXL9_9POAL|nr:hypothetical protein HU200_065802 [Digitaria exilis]